jgi:hypothetical protein
MVLEENGVEKMVRESNHIREKNTLLNSILHRKAY